MTRVGVAIPTYLGAAFIGQAVSSVLNQSYDKWFCVIVNDGQEDGTFGVLEQFNDSRIRYICDGKRRGQFANFNKAIIEVLKGNPDIVRLLCADDVLYPYNLEDIVRVFEQNPKVGLVSSHFDGIDEGDNILFRVNVDDREDLIMAGRDYLLKGLAIGNTIGGPSSVALRYEAIETAGLFDTRVNHSGESDLWHRVAANWDIAWVGHRAGFKYRTHDASITGRGKYSAEKFSNPIQLVRRVASTEAVFGPRWWVHQYTIGRLHSINLQLIGAMAKNRRWDGVKAGITASIQEGLIFYTPFWLPRIPWQVVRLALGLPASRRLFWRAVHERLQPARIHVVNNRSAEIRGLPRI
jgi:glycosyltransferase involved in cell wall biosynthesis